MTFSDFLNTLFSGTNLALLGAALAVIMTGIGSAKGVGMVSEAGAGLLAEDPDKFGKAMILQALPATQGIYGFVIAIVIMAKIGIMGGSGAVVPVDKALMLLAAALPIALVGYFSAIAQGKCAAGSMLMVGRRPEMQGKGMMMTAMVETYAVLALLISFLCVNAIVL